MTRSEQNEAYAAYRAEIAGESMVPALRVTVLVVIGVTATFPLLDWIAFPDVFWPITAIRCAMAVTYAGIWLWTPRAPEKAMIAAAFVEGAHLIAVIGVAGGVASPYYPGIMLLFLGAPILLPLTGRQGAALNGSLLAAFMALPLFVSVEVSARDYMIRVFFAGGAALVGVAGTFLLDRLRFLDHSRRVEITAARDQLAHLDDAKTRFTANVHHELRTPLTLMLAPLEGMRSGDYGAVDPAAERPLRTMLVNGRRLLKLINNLLDLAKLESSQFEVRRAPFEIQDLLETVVDGAVPMAERKGIRLFTESEGEVPSIHADGSALDKVLVNLVGNALKFTDAEGEIGVGARAVADGVEVWVRDTGVGLAPEQLERVFDRFAQVDGSATRKHEGTGIGLSLATELVELHGGRIWAESEGLGHGSTMRFSLPYGEPDVEVDESVVAMGSGEQVALSSSISAVEAELGYETGSATGEAGAKFVELERSAEKWEQHQQGGEPASAELEPGDARPSIVVVDDNADMRELIAFILGRDFKIHAARNGREGLEVARAVGPDLVVTDIMMPEMSGTELCSAIKQDPAIAHIPVMLVSSKAESEMKIEGLELGADDYVTKPFHPRELQVRARGLVELHVLQRAISERNAELERALADLKQAEGQLVVSERLAAVGELAAGVAHEVNNPVNFSLNAARALRGPLGELQGIAQAIAEVDWSEGSASNPQIAALRQRIEGAGIDTLASEVGELGDIVTEGLQRTARLVGDLRDFASAKKRERRAFDLRESVESTVGLLRPTLVLDEVGLSLDLPSDPIVIRGDASALSQVLLNLIKNAAEAFDGAAGAVAVAVARESVPGGETQAVVRVTDDGPGIPDDVQARLFEPFFTTKAAGSGTGLGLSICRRIAHEHAGQLTCESEVGVGTTFTLCVPLADDEGEEAIAG